MTQTNIPAFEDKDKRESSFHNFDEQKEISGKLLGIEQGAYGQQFRIDTEHGEIIVGTYDALKSKITERDVGKFIKIVSLGNKVSQKTKRTYKDFDVYIK